jgi:putative two-component system response regulator
MTTSASVSEERVQATADRRGSLACGESAAVGVRRPAEATIQALLRVIERWDHETGAHVERMSRYAALIAGGAGFDDDRCELIRLAAQMHDVGKVGVPDGILFKPGRLSRAQFDVVKMHAEWGAEILGRGDADLLATAAVIARTHHERWDGAGYPNGLAGQQIPIEGRIAAVADVFDAMVSRRVYKPAHPIEWALDALTEGRGNHFDGELVELLLTSIDRVGEIQRQYPDGQVEPDHRLRVACDPALSVPRHAAAAGSNPSPSPTGPPFTAPPPSGRVDQQ